MPKVRYTFRVVGEMSSFSEEDILPHVNDIALRARQQVIVWNERADENDEPARELVKVEVIDPFIHEHEWVVYLGVKHTGGREYVQCNHCSVKGVRQPRGCVTRDPDYSADKYEFCRDQKPKPRPPKFK